MASVGIVGALNGGILTAHAILGYGFWDLVIAERNLIEDLMAQVSSCFYFIGELCPDKRGLGQDGTERGEDLAREVLDRQ